MSKEITENRIDEKAGGEHHHHHSSEHHHEGEHHHHHDGQSHHHHHHHHHKDSFFKKLKRRLKEKRRRRKKDFEHIKKNARKNRRTIKKIIFTIHIILFIGLILLAIRRLELLEKDDDGIDYYNTSQETGRIVNYNGKMYKPKSYVDTLLIMGIDKFNDQIHYEEEATTNNQQTDFLMLVIIDHKDKKYDLLQINRDTMAEVTELGLNSIVTDVKVEQIALAHAFGNGDKGSCRNTVHSVESLLYGIKIDDYISFTMDVVPIVNDEVGGVKVKIEDDFSAIDPELVMGQTIALKGNQALTYVRARGGMIGDETNVNRMNRHRNFVDGLRKQARDKMNDSGSWIYNLSTKINSYIVSSMVPNDMAKMMVKINDYERADIITIEGETKVTDHVEFYPDDSKLKEQVINLLYTPVEE